MPQPNWTDTSTHERDRKRVYSLEPTHITNRKQKMGKMEMRQILVAEIEEQDAIKSIMVKCDRMFWNIYGGFTLLISAIK